jgi:hypothetical protein
LLDQSNVSTAGPSAHFGVKNAPKLAQDDGEFVKRTSDSGHHVRDRA